MAIKFPVKAVGMLRRAVKLILRGILGLPDLAAWAGQKGNYY
jgi:hypothetical protein